VECNAGEGAMVRLKEKYAEERKEEKGELDDMLKSRCFTML